MFKEALIAWLIGYLFGCIPAAYLAGKIKGIDLSKEGSRNLGATNAGRILGKKIGLVVLAIDTLKGVLACLIFIKDNQLLAVLAGTGAVLGHIFSLPGFILTRRIRGGRGVATALGVSIIIYPTTIIILCLFIFLILSIRHRVLPIDILFTAVSGTLLSFLFHALKLNSDAQLSLSIFITTILSLTHLSYISSFYYGNLEYSMFKKDTESIDIIKIRQSIKSLKVNDGITFEEFLHNAKMLSQKEFEFIKCEMPVGVTGSISIGEKAYIFYDANVSPLHQIQIKLHEIAHLILGHTAGQELTKEIEFKNSILKTQEVYDKMLQGQLKREQYNDTQEKEAELLATEILGRLRLELDFNNDPLVGIGLE